MMNNGGDRGNSEGGPIAKARVKQPTDDEVRQRQRRRKIKTRDGGNGDGDREGDNFEKGWTEKDT